MSLKLCTNNSVFLDHQRTCFSVMQVKDGTMLYNNQNGEKIPLPFCRYMLSSYNTPNPGVGSKQQFEDFFRAFYNKHLQKTEKEC